MVKLLLQKCQPQSHIVQDKSAKIQLKRSNPIDKRSYRWKYRESTNRRDGRGVDGKEWDLINLGSEYRDLRIGVGKGESIIARGQLNRAVVKEFLPRCERNSQGESIGPLHLGVEARRVHSVCVACIHRRHHRHRHRRNHQYLQTCHGRSRSWFFLAEITRYRRGPDSLQTRCRLATDNTSFWLP